MSLSACTTPLLRSLFQTSRSGNLNRHIVIVIVARRMIFCFVTKRNDSKRSPRPQLSHGSWLRYAAQEHTNVVPIICILHLSTPLRFCFTFGTQDHISHMHTTVLSSCAMRTTHPLPPKSSTPSWLLISVRERTSTTL
jgi:hypothetical protein